MKYTLLLWLLSLLFTPLRTFAQEAPAGHFSGEWKRVDSLEKAGLYRSAWTAVRKIYAAAAARHEDQEQIKALIYGLKYRSLITEDAEAANIREVDSLSRTAGKVPGAILKSMLAEMYRDYAAAHRYSLYNRISSTSEDPEDIATWSLRHLNDRIATLYEASLLPASALKKIHLSGMNVLADTGIHALRLRPTLYDLLAQRALDFFTSPDQEAVVPAGQFMIESPGAFGPPAEFAALTFSPGDTASFGLKALRLYQDLIRFHLADSDPAALGDVNLDRLQFVHGKAVMPGKDSLYVNALRQILQHQTDRVTLTKASFLLAQWYDVQGSRYGAFVRPRYRYDLKKALEICRTVPAGPVTAGSLACRRLEAAILRPELSLQAEQVNVPDMPFRVLVTCRNDFRLWFRLVKLPEAPAQVFAREDLGRKALKKMEVFRQWQQDFPDQEDYQSHSAEMKVAGLSHGRYALLASGDSTFEEGRYPVESVVFFVSDISCVDNHRGDYVVVDRKTGKPLRDALVRLWTAAYNADSGKSLLKGLGQYRTDRNGYFHCDSAGNLVMPEISYHGDHLYTGNAEYLPVVASGSPKDSVQQKTWLFTDRSIYRPGQTLYFKGIVFSHDPRSRESHVTAGRTVRVFLVDAGGRKADSLQLTTNDFGSYTGHFLLPAGSLNGSMRLEAEPGEASAYFSVEDYKRPGFYIRWDTAGRSYRLGDTVTVSGRVAAYTEAVVSGAKINYQVYRRTRRRFFPFSSERRLIAYPQQTLIAQDTGSTDAAGSFSIPFPALPDPEADSSLHPVFDFTVSVQVTDINGETRSASYLLPLGYKSLQLDWDVPDRIPPAGPDTLRLKSVDLSGTFVPADAAIRLFPLVPPSRYIRPRYWNRPDTHLMDRKTYLSLFPHDEYDNESEPETWPRKPAVLTLQIETQADGSLPLPATSLSPGWYALEATASDRYGRTVTAVKYLQVYGSKKPAFSAPLWSSTGELQGQPGAPASWEIAADRHSFVFRQEETLKGTGTPAVLKLRRGLQEQKLAVDTGDRGGVIMHYFTVKDNRLYTRDVRIGVPWKDKELYFTYSTFRDRLLPGAEETWSVRITGEDSAKAAAEVLASMYDASLDAFRPHDWIRPDLYPALRQKASWGRTEKDALSSSSLYQPPFPSFPGYELAYPSLRWFGYRPAVWRPTPLAMAGVIRQSAVREGTAVQFKREAAPPVVDTAAVQQIPVLTEPEVRKNFRETAFFLPQLRTDDSGAVIFSFTMPEALTTWKLMLFAHTPDMRYGFSSRKVVTRKPLMIHAAAPRFVRQGDSLIFNAKISNLSGQDLSGLASLQLSDPVSGEDVDSIFGNLSAPFAFVVRAGSSIVASWALVAPDDYTGALQYRLTADAGDYSDGEQDALPVLSNRTLFTETLPLHFRGNGLRQVQWEVLKKMTRSRSVLPSGLTVTCAANPVWYAVLALPLLDKNGRQSSDALFDQLYARSLSGYILDSNPGFSSVLDQWTSADTTALKSSLQENQDFKTVLLQETPWVQASRDEAAAKAEVAAWYREAGNKSSLRDAVDRLKDMQLAGGAFPWFQGTGADNTITRRILTGLGHLKHLGAWPQGQQKALSAITAKGVPYLDGQMKVSYEQLMKRKQGERTLSAEDAAYLYMRSFFPGTKMADSVREVYGFYQDLARKEWTAMPPHLQAMIALALYRSGDITTPEAILTSLSERALHDQNGGMYWKENKYGYLWYQAPLEAESICMEAFHEITGDSSAVADMAGWLLEQKQAESWPTDRATAHAVYALLLGGSQWTASSPVVKIRLGGRTVDSSGGPGAGYSRGFIAGPEITPAMGNITVNVQGAAQGQPVWVSLYYQYFGRMERAVNSGAGLSVSRQISLEKPGPYGPELVALTGGEPLHTGDRVQVRMVVKAERDLDYVHLKDVRASCMEPVQTLSGYQGGQGTFWYSTVAGAAMHFYFRHLSRGTYVFTYPVYISRPGSFMGGMTTIECLYAPEFRAHSEGVKVNVGQ